MPKGANGLTHRQERFCRNFAAGFHAARAEACDGPDVLLGTLESVFRGALGDRHDQAAQALESKSENGKMTRNDEVFFGHSGESRLFIKSCGI